MLGHLPEQPRLLRDLAPLFRTTSLARIEAARAKLPRRLPEYDVVGSDEHLEVAQSIADHSVTVTAGADRLPLTVIPDEGLALVSTPHGNATPADSSAAVELRLEQQLRARHPALRHVCLPEGATASDMRTAVQAVAGCATVIVATIDAVGEAIQRQLLTEVARGRHLLVHLALRSPADATLSPAGAVGLCTYGIRPVSTEAAVRVLFGEIPARGVLPVRLPNIQASEPR
jgi:hypothetical protein